MVRTSNYNMACNLTLQDFGDFITNVMDYAVKDNYDIFHTYMCAMLVISVLIHIITWKKHELMFRIRVKTSGKR